MNKQEKYDELLPQLAALIEGETEEMSVLANVSAALKARTDADGPVWHGLECLEPSVLLECKEGPFIEHEVDGILEIKK